MSLHCDIELDNNNANFQPGQTISGRLRVSFSERTIVKALALKIAGYAATRFEKPLKANKSKPKQDPEFYTQREDYLYTINYYIGSENAHPNFIEASTLSYQFSVRLPEACPSSFENTFGHVRYELEVFIDYPDHRYICYTRAIHVQQPFDLREVAGMAQTLERMFVEQKSIVRFWQKPLQMSVRVPRTGFVPGEEIAVHVKVINYNHLALKEIVYKLNLIATVTGVHKKKTIVKVTRTNLVTIVHGIFSGTIAMVEQLQSIIVPVTPPDTNVSQCKCIQIGYELEVTVNSTNKRRSIIGALPISIGTISLSNRHDLMNKESSREAMAVPSANLVPPNLLVMRSMEDLSSVAADLAPSAPRYGPEGGLSTSLSSLTLRDASYMPAMALNKNSKKTLVGDLTEFKPKYLYYEIDSILEEAQAKAEASAP